MSTPFRVASRHSFRPFSKVRRGSPGARVALRPRPRLRLRHERPQLVEQVRAASAHSELVDAREPRQHTFRFVHPSTVARPL